MLSFFKKKKSLVTDIGWLGVDLHSHLLPGLDDGSPDVETSMHLIKSLYELGFERLICTPHIFKELYPNTAATIMPALALVKTKIKTTNLPVSIAAAGEHMIDDNFVVNDDLLCLKDKYILIEMSYLYESPRIEQVIFDLQIAGYQVVLAHPERYTFYYKNYHQFERYKDMGVLFQLNLLSVTGYYGKEVKRTAEFLLEKHYYDLAATDLHHENHLKALTSVVVSGKLYEKLGDYPFKNKEIF
ncbi:tyrosine-protein phosphatase [Pedobacter frigiditerrae]|uniref:tyrosine-protein phosphatase n=1 Tax=Pedobacter frigiditerrae TaxID=2530452 RepID=UPI002931ABCB|nr:CpsB/CapC family capsule biosynthesis tyrosine phosphatase [Pedobacter frigiditerrae]